MVVDSFLPVFIFVSRVCDVSLGTLRVIAVTRGRRTMAVVLGFFETLIWIIAVSGVITRLDQVINIVAYAAGFAAGNAVGMWIEARMAMGLQAVSFVSRGAMNAVAQGLRNAKFCVTFGGTAQDGPVSICHAIVARKQTPQAIRLARESDPEVTITVEDVREFSTLANRALTAAKRPLGIGRLLRLKSLHAP